MLRAMKNDTILSGTMVRNEERKIERRAKARGSYRPIGEHETFGARRGDTQELVPAFLGSAVILIPRSGSDRSQG
jgi:hypothetical protein